MSDQTPKDEKTEEATPKRRDEARDKGQVAMSQDVVAAVMLLMAVLAFYVAGQNLVMSLVQLTAGITGRMHAWALNDMGFEEAAAMVAEPWWAILPNLFLVLMPMLAIGALAAFLQAGFRITPKALEMKWSKLDPIKGAQKIVGPRGFVRLGQSMLKLIVIASVTVAVAYSQLGKLAALGRMELPQALVHGTRLIAFTAICAIVAILAIALIDLLFQRQQHDKELRMSKNEVKQEMKNSQGDPEVKRRIRQVQREMSARRMMDDVPNATVVVTNPTHYAVALYYEKDANGQPLVAAPKVVAKGVDSLAQKIKEIASENGVILYEDVPLARALHARCEIGDVVPVELFEAVAAVIRYVYGLREVAARA
ncbi:Flagellar biosynthetic protein FlhB [Planctomycetes bacterium Pla163]|uniref:Flagellar biosynthetic protein FlhB n=1 Tax=Rohdeia mirabilis TaxID=2528008 RepID=A0A518D4S2_9BACT|nr:Flagellar biosynthetic protein FlhB [Planctomycetes bacterium Pla163]